VVRVEADWINKVKKMVNTDEYFKDIQSNEFWQVRFQIVSTKGRFDLLKGEDSH